jgi:uncharacterized membrane protein
LNIGKSTAPLREKLIVHLPFSIYLGWITIATIANVAAFLVSVNWDGFGISRETWAILIIIIALIITLLVIITRKDVAYALVIIWALTGIAVNQTANPNIITAVEASAATAAITLAAILFYSKLRNK